MNIVRYIIPGRKKKDKPVFGIIEKDIIFPVHGTPYGKLSVIKRKRIKASDVKLCAPCEPSKIILVGLNYRDHAHELGMQIPEEPIIFLKPACAVVGHKGVIRYPSSVGRLDFEAELAVVMKKQAKDIKPQNVKDYILGYTCLNDVTARDLQKKDGQWTRAKSFDTFCPIGPWISTGIHISNLDIKLFLNGVIKQHSHTGNQIFSIESLISFISGIMTLFPGDVISSGTPPGVDRMMKGDTVRVEIEKIGALENYVR